MCSRSCSCRAWGFRLSEGTNSVALAASFRFPCAVNISMIDELGKHPAHLEHGATPAAARSVVDLAESRRQHVADTVEKLIANSIHTAFIKCPEGDGDANMDYDWISSEQSSRITKAILLDLAANGFEIVKKGAA